MTPVTVKLKYEFPRGSEVTTYNLIDGKAEFVSVEGTDSLYGEYLRRNDGSNVDLEIDELDVKMVETYLEMFGKDIIETAQRVDATIWLQKEIWFDYEYAISERWLAKDDFTMCRRSTKLEYCNHVLDIVNAEYY